MFQRGTSFSRGGIVILLLVGFYVQICLTRMFVYCGDHMCNQQSLMKYVVNSKNKSDPYSKYFFFLRGHFIS
jgi:hypothetical protein